MNDPESEYSPGFGLDDLRALVPEAAVQVPAISGWSVGMHIEHVCLAMIEVCRSLLASELPAPASGFRPLTWLVLTTGRIPRGRAKSPEPALPKQGVEAGELTALLDECSDWLGRAAAASPDQWFEHFVFGVLKRDRTLRFLEVHNRHHLRIAGDILRARVEGE